ncbi:SusC/RagA family TonB-linked outer membrane protein [Dawidia soli]|uniref:TonB-dependent receptor n=1 Tax=Dawidia soli TaxID=2782352 RepID=A0AAP2DB18_9BACT|nr:TonB-dependent receptor [Dawidia soli]MBT1687610.1 TonB-dependent receptor [Dawidia soli]
MRVTLINLLIVSFTMSMVYAIDAEAQEVLERRVTLNVDAVEVQDVLTLLGKQAKVKFTYNPSQIPIHNRITMHVVDRKLSDVLADVLHENIDYKVIGKQIALKPLHPSLATATDQPLASTTDALYGPIITGRISDPSGSPLPGVNVIVKGTTIGTTANGNGEYTLEVPGDDAILVFSFIGYATQEVLTSGRTSIDVTLQEDIQSLGEVIVVGYGTQEKKEVTSAISQVSGDDIRKSSAISISNSLAGRMPGLIVNQRNAEPGRDDASIFIRGIATTGNSQALIVIDGVANRDGISRLDPNDIETLTVLKDASAAIYGAQAANGVVLITTKRGRTGKPTLNYSFNQGFVSPTRFMKMANAATFARSVNDILPNFYTDEQIAQYQNGTRSSTNWMKESFDPYYLQNRHNLTLTGGTEAVKYFISGGTAYQGPLLTDDETTEYRQYNLRSNIDAQMSKILTIGLDLAGRRENRNFLQTNPNTTFQAALLTPPTLPATIRGLPARGRLGQNPLAIAAGRGYDKLERTVLNSTFKLDLKLPFIEGLSADGFAALDIVNDFRKIWQQPYTFYDADPDGNPVPAQSSETPQLTENYQRQESITLNAKLKYERTFGAHHVTGFVAYEQNENRMDSLSARRTGFESGEIDQLFAGSQSNQTADGTARKGARQNYFGRLTYDYADKYFVQAHFRYDGSQIFPPGERFGFFPGVSLGWRISEEAFMQDQTILSNLKLRGSWGKLGNDRVKPFQYLDVFSFNIRPGGNYVVDDEDVQVLNPAVISNPNITWEKQTTTDIGVEAGFLDNHLTVEADVFFSKRKDILWPRNVSVPQYTGMQLPTENIGKVENKGIDGQITYRGTVGELQFTVGANITFARNKIVFLDDGDIFTEVYQKREGHPVGEEGVGGTKLAYEVVGIYRTDEDLTRYPSPGARKGDFIYRDVNGDGIIDTDDRVRQDRTSTPQLQYGFNLGAQWNGFDLSLLFQGQGLAAQEITYNFGAESNAAEYFLENAWREDFADAPMARINSDYSKATNSVWMRDIRFLRLKSIELGYTLPHALVSRVGIQNVRFYVNGFNLLTFDSLKKDGLPDPESTNIQGWVFPQTKSINFGLNLTL